MNFFVGRGSALLVIKGCAVGPLSCKSQRPDRGEPGAVCAACTGLDNGIIDYLFTPHNNSAVYLITGASQSPTPTPRELFEPLRPYNRGSLLDARADEAGQRLSILWGCGCGDGHWP